MGANHVSVVYAQWGHILDGRPFRLLVHMALTAKDSDSPPKYWAGRDGMAAALGRNDDPAGHQAVKRALSVLKREGAVKLDRAPRKARHTARWVLVLTPPSGVTNRTPILPDSGDGHGSQTDPPSGTKSDPIGGHKTTDRGTETDPQRTTRTNEERDQEENTSSQVSTDRAREEQQADPMTPFEAAQILQEGGKRGVKINPLIDSAPASCDTKTKRRVWAARQVLAMREEATA